MKNYTIKKYQPEDYANWNAFVSNAKNATFLFHRDFMEYHNDRFEDFSLVILDGENWVAILPANRSENQVFSHQGLTYGGILIDKKMKQSSFLHIFKSVLEFLNSNQIEKLSIKMMPSIYFDFPSDELNYALFLTEAKLVRRDSLSVIDLQKNFKISKIRLRGVKKGQNLNLNIVEEDNFDGFWNAILIPNLEKKYNVKPVHSLDEIKLLHSRFQRNIRQFNVYKESEIVAGVTIFESKNVIHSQYISGQEDKNALGALDYLYHYLLTDVFKQKHFLMQFR